MIISTKRDAINAEKAIQQLIIDWKNRRKPLPILAYYGVGRAYQSTFSAPPQVDPQTVNLKSRLEDGYRNCLKERISIIDLQRWFFLESASRDVHGKFRLSYETVKFALMQSISGIKDVRYDFDRRELCINIAGKEMLFSHLSDGQRTMISMVVDIAIRAITLNSYLLANSAKPETILIKTPGVVLIDELDVHLHPKWQRSAVKDLIRTFPNIQFICSSHSPQIFGELPQHQIRLYDVESKQWLKYF